MIRIIIKWGVSKAFRQLLVLELVEFVEYDFLSFLELSAAIGWDYGEHEIRTVRSCLVVNNFKIKNSEYY